MGRSKSAATRSYLFELSLIYNWGVQLPTEFNVKAADQLQLRWVFSLTIEAWPLMLASSKITAWLSTIFKAQFLHTSSSAILAIGIAYILLAADGD